VKLAASVGINFTFGTLLAAISAFGEELGRRSYMLTRLIDAGVPRPILVSGLIWTGWHLLLILRGQYAAGPPPLLSALLFTLSVTGAGYVAARVRLESGSLWPAAVFHSSWNALIQALSIGSHMAAVRRTRRVLDRRIGHRRRRRGRALRARAGRATVARQTLPKDEPTEWVSIRTS
jgi:membrane protease YdiL (CAAX protease family)